MVSIVKQPLTAPAALTCAGLSTLAAGTYVTSSAYNNTTNQQSDLIVELSATPNGTTTGNQQVVLFGQASLDGVTWQSGPGSGTTTTDEVDLTPIATLAVKTASGPQARAYSVASAFGYLPPYVRFVVKNDCGVALSAGSLRTSELSLTVG